MAEDLKHDRLPDVRAIAAYVGTTERRVRHLIEKHNFPIKRVGAKIESRKSWVDEFYARPDQPASKRGQK
jgi:hypothetical protein